MILDRLAAAAVLASACALSAAAASAQSRWTILGPAVSYHASDEHAQVQRQELVDTHCVRPLPTAPVVAAPRCRQIVSVEQTRRWNERHAAIGLERRQLGTRRTARVFTTLIEDSYGQLGLMGGAGWTWRVAQWNGWQSHVGVAGGLWRRTVLEDDATHLRRATRLFAMPVLLIDSPTVNVGVSVSYLPSVSIGGNPLNPTSVWTLQLRLTPPD